MRNRASGITNHISAGLFIFTALECEAKPLLGFFGLKKDSQNHPFSIYKNQYMVLTVTGVGKIAMAGAVAYVLALFAEQPSPVLINIGIAGHKTSDLGSLHIAVKIVDGESGQCFYPQLPSNISSETCEIKTMSLASKQYNQHYLYDMEASAFYEMSVRFSSCELIHCLKVISDNEQHAIEKVSPQLVTEWIKQQMPEIERFLVHLLNLSNALVTVELPEYHEIVKKWHFTANGHIKLKGLLLRWQVLSKESWLAHYAANLKNSKQLLQKLADDVNNLEVSL